MTLLLLTCQTAQGHHVIFENIGQMAGALSYMHCKLTLNISSIFLQHQAYSNALMNLQRHILDNEPGMHPTRWYYQERMAEYIQNVYKNQKQVIQMHINGTADITDQLNTLRAILPEVASAPSNVLYNRRPRDADRNKYNGPKADVRFPRFLNFLSLPMGVFGTFMGLYNKAQIDRLQDQLQGTIAKHNRLVEVVQDHEHFIQDLNRTVEVLIHTLNIRNTYDPALTSTRLSHIENQIKDRANIAVHVIQQAQHRRLAVDFLSHTQLRLLYSRLQKQAEENGCQLLTQQHSDLFQLEASYFFDGKDVHILLHVPMVPKESLLRLFRLHPFPLPLTKEHSLMPVSDHNILALSSGFVRYSAQFSHNDLMGCHVVNNVYLCERHGVLNQNLNSTCLGSLYQQDFEAVKTLCPLEIHKAGEIVHQLLDNWFLAYSPKAQTVPIDCRNGTSSELYLSRGINKFYLSPGCKAHLLEHLVMSDISLKLDTDILHFEWRWNDVALEQLKPDYILPQLELMQAGGMHRPTFSDLQQMTVEMKRSPGWWAHLVNFVGNAVLFSLLLAAILFALVRLYRFRKARRQHQKLVTRPHDTTDSVEMSVRPTPAQRPSTVLAAAGL
jgi:hypothetical protein